MNRIACLLVICVALCFVGSASACDPCGNSAAVFVQQQRAFFVQPSNAVFLNSGPFIGNGFGGGGNANVNIVENRRGLLGRRSSSVIQAQAGGGFGGGNANINVVRR